MKNIILFTSNLSIEKSWKSALEGKYTTTLQRDFEELLEYLNTKNEISILMLDELSISNIEEALHSLAIFSSVKILIFNNFPKVEHAITLINRGISGYENSYIAKENLLKMLRGIEEGNRWFFKDLTYYIINKYVDITSHTEPEFLTKLTHKEKDIAYLIADGFTNKEIAIKEKIALSTVKGHISHIFEKADVTDRVALALKFR